MENALSILSGYLPARLDLMSMLKFTVMFTAGALLIGLIGRFVSGKRSTLNHAVSSAIGILVIYALTIAVLTFRPWELEKFLSPLPFVGFSDQYMTVFPLGGTEISEICRQILSLVIIAFLMNLLDSVMPKGKGILRWYLNRFASVALAMGLHYAVNWLFNAYLPGVLVTYAPMILLGVLGFMLLLGLLKVLLGLVLTVVNPILGGIYTFFFANKIGKMLTKAVLTTIILCVVVYLVEFFGFTVIAIDTNSLISYVPFTAVLLVLWYVIGHIL